MIPRPDRTASRRANCFDFIRLFAAASVVVGHATRHLKVSFLWLEPGGRYWFRDGVPLFFILSGYLVYRSCQKCIESDRPLLQFYINRFLRIAPAIYVYALVTGIFVFATGALALDKLATPQFALWFVSNFALIPVYNASIFSSIGIGVLNGSLWTIPVECSFYVMVPLVALAARRLGVRTMLGALWLLVATGLLADWLIARMAGESLPYKLLNVTFLPYLIFFALGIVWTYAWEWVPDSGTLAFACALLYGVVRWGPIHPDGFLERLLIITWTAPLSYAAIWFGYHGPAIFSRLTLRLGDLSFGTYIWHMIVINFVLYFNLVRRSNVAVDTVQVLSVLGIVFAIAWVSWHLIEAPALRLKPYTSRTAPSAIAESRGQLPVDGLAPAQLRPATAADPEPRRLAVPSSPST